VRWLDSFCSWLDQSALSQTIQTTAWIVPTVQTIHILSVAMVVASALMIDFRLIGAFAVDQPLKRVSQRFLPLVWWPLLILLATGAIMIIGEPARSLKSPIFQLKMGLLAAAIAVTGMLGRGMTSGTLATGSRCRAWLTAIPSIMLWVGIIFAGRWIAYW
jgi:hypothetical protein